MKHLPIRLSRIFFLWVLSAGFAVAAPGTGKRYIYGCRLTGHSSQEEAELLNFPLMAPSASHSQTEKVEQSNRKTTLTITLAFNGKFSAHYVDNIYRLNLGSFRGNVPEVNPEKEQFGKIEKTFVVKKKHSFPYEKYSLICE